LSESSEKPIVLREICEFCAKPIFPIRAGQEASTSYRPGFCNCALGTIAASNDAPTEKTSPGPDTAREATEQFVFDQKREPDAGHKIKLPTGTTEAPWLANSPLAQPEVDTARPSGSRFDPSVQLTDLIAAGYTFFDRVGKGTMGYVYQAKSENLDTLLAVKIFHRAPFKNKRTLKRLEQEASLAMGIAHPHLASVYKFGLSEKEYPYIVMDFMPGPSLNEILLQEGYLDSGRAIDMFIQIAESLEYAHGEKLLHRSLKPSNIFVLKAIGGRDFIKVSDFGIAKVLPNPGRETKYMTAQGEEFGNPAYMSPEQCLGERLDSRSDIYSLGCIMYECLSGKVPHNSSNVMRIAFKQVSEEAKSLVERFTDLDIAEDLDNVVLACLKKNPDHRFASAKELRLALEAVRDYKKPRLPSAAGSPINKPGGSGQNILDKIMSLLQKPKGSPSGNKTDHSH